MTRWRNWSGEVAYEGLAEIYRPRTLAELREGINDARERGLQVCAVGAGHSWSNLGLTEHGGAILRTDRLDRRLSFNRDAMTATVDAGIRLAELNDWLFEHGLSLPTMGDTDRQSLAGAVSTDTHGSGAELHTLANYVEGVTLVLSDGSVYEVPEAELPAARVSLGVLGVIHSLTVQVVDAVYLEHTRTTVRFEDEKHELDDLLQEFRHMEYWYFPYTDYADRIVRKPIGPVPVREYPLRAAAMASEAVVADVVGQTAPEQLPRLFRFGTKQRLDDTDYRKGPAHKILPLVAQSTVDILRTHTMEYLVSYDALWDAFDELRASIEEARRRDVYVSVPIHIRFVKKSERILLSPCVHDLTASFSVNFSRNYAGAHTWFPDLERRLIALGGKPHWGKIYYQRPEIPEGFHAIRRRLDPVGMFWNPQPLYQPDN